MSRYLLVDNDWSPDACLGGQSPAARVRGELLHRDDGGRGLDLDWQRDPDDDPGGGETRVMGRTIGDRGHGCRILSKEINSSS